MKINPFNPNSPINPGMFIGRIEEIKRLEAALVQTKENSPAHFMIIGERGIGKTSLLLYLKYVAEGSIPIDNEKLKFAIIDLDINSNTTQINLIKRIQVHLDEQLSRTEPAKKFLKDTWSFLQRIRIMDSGISETETEKDSEVIMDQFALNMAKLTKQLCDGESENPFSAKYDGILVIIDEVDNCSEELQIGSFLKNFLERLQRNGCNRVLIGLAGLPEVRNKLYASHASSLRIFEEILLGRLSDQEVIRVIDVCLEKANKQNVEKVSITAEARKNLVSMSEGYPHFIQQFGSSAFSYDTDGTIDRTDIMKSAYGDRGALDLIGDRYYRNDFYEKIRREDYRQVLRIMADDLDDWVRRSKIKSKFKGSDSTLNNALRALRDRHIILSKEGEHGVYRLQHRGFAIWIKLYADPEFRKILTKQEKDIIDR